MLIPLIVACALFMENLDSSVLATALPSIAADLGESPLKLNLAITSYLFALAVFIPVSGWVADRFGARTVFRAAIAVFTIGSLLCGFADSFWFLVGARVLQGLGGAMMVPVGRLVMLRSIPKAELVRAIAWLTVPALIGPVIGPPLGGFLTTYLSWRWIFWINLPIGLLGMVLVTLYIPNIREENVPALDWRGFAFSAIGLLGLVFGFETIGRELLPDTAVAGLLLAGAIGVALYLRHARRHPHPLLDLSLLKIPTFRAGIAGGFLFRIGTGALPFLLPMMLQLGFGLSAFESGMVTFASAAGALTMKMAAGPILRWLGFRHVLIGNALISGAFIAVCGFFRPEMSYALIFALLLLGGFFRSLQFTSVNTLTISDVSNERMSRATSFTSMMQQLSLSAGVAVGALILHVTVSLNGAPTIGPADFMPAFFSVGVAAMLSALLFLRLPADAGAEVSGHRLVAPTQRLSQGTPAPKPGAPAPAPGSHPAE
ncbi:MAG TPA: DHA2 family efflux MFS transporter permease subunit [Ferrovibrio sp.]|uniref:DHA2 family efflux MFS transporter permease subunit n=1 Tax=Ferrovibrio sp. TaxID=1917215 RepID=UPI002B4B80E2|nr:DHA2 family efflux MFS transporter permease subunit [Ferrovibrio sp.]HLT78423.1 DHA2 family efflux MFS transporter permease subunit [Ferrovibrio sp.]